MSVETDFRALLAGFAGLTALVGDRIALNSIAEGASLPLVVFSVNHDPTHGLDNTMLADQCTISVQAWGRSADEALDVADAIIAALATAPAARGATATGRWTMLEPELGLDGATVQVEWWA